MCHRDSVNLKPCNLPADSYVLLFPFLKLQTSASQASPTLTPSRAFTHWVKGRRTLSCRLRSYSATDARMAASSMLPPAGTSAQQRFNHSASLINQPWLGEAARPVERTPCRKACFPCTVVSSAQQQHGATSHPGSWWCVFLYP